MCASEHVGIQLRATPLAVSVLYVTYRGSVPRQVVRIEWTGANFILAVYECTESPPVNGKVPRIIDAGLLTGIHRLQLPGWAVTQNLMESG